MCESASRTPSNGKPWQKTGVFRVLACAIGGRFHRIQGISTVAFWICRAESCASAWTGKPI
jgi:hypothetical protein